VCILGVETSCDETSCALVVNGREVLSNAVASQIDLHARFGGVVPEIASRAHIEAVNSVLQQALSDAGVGRDDISAVAVTNEPGLIGSLLIGLMAAKTVAWVWDRPLIAVNHIYAHAHAAALDGEPVEYPAVALICSGGHTALYECRSATDMTLLGGTLDDAAGEAFDKVASILGLGYPGGPVIDAAARSGNPRAVRFPRSMLSGESLDFSFSGLKTAVLYHVNGVPGAKRGREATGEAACPLSADELADVAASFQAAVVDVLTAKLARAAERCGPRSLLLGGGVAANSALRAAAGELAGRLGCTLRLPKMAYCLDNAAMIAGVAYDYYRTGRFAGLDLEAHPTVRR
jgi:N6-L-threonylcarbamoyladenine synthase